MAAAHVEDFVGIWDLATGQLIRRLSAIDRSPGVMRHITYLLNGKLVVDLNAAGAAPDAYESRG